MLDVNFFLRLVNLKKQPVAKVAEFTGVSKSSIWRWLRNGVRDKHIQRTQPALKDIASTHNHLAYGLRRDAATQQEHVEG